MRLTLFKAYLSLLKTHPRYLTYGVLHNFFSSFGQTFVIALFVPSIIEAYNLSRTDFSSIFSAVTIVSAVVFTFVGGIVDRSNLRKFSLTTGICVVVACLILALWNTLVGLVVGLFLIRHSGQALMTHVSSTAIARYFTDLRGKALSVSALGLSFGEAFFPPMIALLLTAISWQNIFLLLAVGGVLVFFPLSYKLLPAADEFLNPVRRKTAATDAVGKRGVLKSAYFYFVLPHVCMGPLILTGLIFHQATIADLKGWSLTLIGTAFVSFAICRVGLSFFTGPLIDRYGARRLLPFYMLPTMLAACILMISDHETMAFVYLALAGATIGIGATVKQALWAEVYGVAYLGSIRSLTTPIMVIATAVGPPIYGYLFDQGYTLNEVLIGTNVIIGGAAVLAAMAPKYQGLQTAS